MLVAKKAGTFGLTQYFIKLLIINQLTLNTLNCVTEQANRLLQTK